MAEIQSVFLEAMAAATSTAFHLEMRDHYGVAVEAEDFARWQQSGERDMDPASEYWSDFIRLVRETLGRGVELRRARIVSEPVSDYIRFEHAGTSVNVAAGEQVRWLGLDNRDADLRMVLGQPSQGTRHQAGDGAGEGSDGHRPAASALPS